MTVAWYVWSRGLERWERIHPSSDDIPSFTFVHAKNVRGLHFAVCVDPLGRYVGGLHREPIEWVVTDVDGLPQATRDDQADLVASMSRDIALEIDNEVVG